VARRVSWADLAIVGGARPGAQLRLTDTDIYGRRLTAVDTDAEKLARRSRAASPAPLLARGPRQDTGLRSLPLQGYAQLHLKSPASRTAQAATVEARKTEANSPGRP